MTMSAPTPTVQTLAYGCSSLVSMVTSCSRKIYGFTDLPNREQASCICCHTSARTTVWTDEFDDYASSCASWAVTDGPYDLWTAARNLATFCDYWDDICTESTSPSFQSPRRSSTPETVTVTPTPSRAAPPTIDFSQIVTVTVTAPPSSPPSSDDGGGGLSKGAIAGIAVGVGAVVLLILAGAFFMWRKNKKKTAAAPEPAETVQIQPSGYFGSTSASPQQPIPVSGLPQAYPVKAVDERYQSPAPPYQSNPTSPTSPGSPPAVAPWPPAETHELHGQDRSMVFEMPAEHSTGPRNVG